MDDAGLVRGREPVGNLIAKRRASLSAAGLAPRSARQRTPVDVLHRDEVEVVVFPIS